MYVAHTRTHAQHVRKWFNNSSVLPPVPLTLSSSVMTEDSKAQLRLPFRTFTSVTLHSGALYDRIQLTSERYLILPSQQSAVTAIVLLHLQANGSLKTMSSTNEGVVTCQPFSPASDAFPCARRWELADCPSRVRRRWGIYCSHQNIVGVRIPGLSWSVVIFSIVNRSGL